jgi:hypothetical protein
LLLFYFIFVCFVLFSFSLFDFCNHFLLTLQLLFLTLAAPYRCSSIPLLNHFPSAFQLQLTMSLFKFKSAFKPPNQAFNPPPPFTCDYIKPITGSQVTTSSVSASIHKSPPLPNPNSRLNHQIAEPTTNYLNQTCPYPSFNSITMVAILNSPRCHLPLPNTSTPASPPTPPSTSWQPSQIHHGCSIKPTSPKSKPSPCSNRGLLCTTHRARALILHHASSHPNQIIQLPANSFARIFSALTTHSEAKPLTISTTVHHH